MIINGKDYLLCEKRGCEFFKGDTIRERSDMENYRVFIDVECADGVRVFGDLLRCNVYDYTKKNPRLIYDCGLAADLQSDMYRYHPSADPKEYEYTKKDVLRFVNAFSGNHFEEIKWIQTFDATIEKGANFTPASLVIDFAKKHSLETTCAYGETVVNMYTGSYKYLCYKVTPINEKLDRVTITMEQA